MNNDKIKEEWELVIDFFLSKLDQAREEERRRVGEEVLEKIKELRRTDAAQMNCDHVYDEALGDLDTIVRYISGKGKA